jgi:hypothetical protein
MSCRLAVHQPKSGLPVELLHRIKSDISARRNLDTYVATVIAIVFAALGVVGDIVPDSLKWSALFAGVGMLLFRITLPARPGRSADQIFADRAEYDASPLPRLLNSATQLWIFAPSAINILSPQNCEAIRQKVLSKSGGDVRITVLDPNNDAAVALAVKQLDESLQYRMQGFRPSLAASTHQLETMAQWQVAGVFSYGYLDYNPGFSLVAINPHHRDGRVIVELHGFRNESTASRMHFTLTRSESDRWYQYWVNQFEEIWNTRLQP